MSALSPGEIERIATELDGAIQRIVSAEDLEQFRRAWLGKEGTLKLLLKQLRDVPQEERAGVAAGLNSLRERAERFVAERGAALEREKRGAEISSTFHDLSLPGYCAGAGRVHPVTRVERRFASLLAPFGFRLVPGPEIETEYYCFDSLNIPKHHPARDMQDTFYTDTGHLLRTHTTSVQARELEKGELPVKVASFGRVYRNETEDPSHQAMFHQFELVWVDKGLTLSHLMALITHILKGLYGKRARVRFVPKYYPYTEPSIGPQIDCARCGGKGCSLCGGSGWLTVGGAGMVHRNVLLEFKYDPAAVSGLAFGMGTSRLAAQLCGVGTLREIYENDLRVLKGRP